MKQGKLIVAASVDNADMLYATGFSAPDPFVYFSVGKEEAIILSTLEYNRGISESKENISVLNRDDLLLDFNDSDTKSVLHGLSKKYSVESWLVPEQFPLVYADFLRSLGIDIECCNGAFFPERASKKSDEIDKITAALRVAELGEAKAFELISSASVGNDNKLYIGREVLTSEILRSEIEIEMLRNGGTGTDTIAACGPHSSEPHNTGSGPIYANQPIIVDIFPRIDKTGYWGDITRTYLKGKAPSIVSKAYKAVKSARDKAKENIKTGVSASKIHQLAFDILVQNGFKTGHKNNKHYGFIHGLGHGVGLEIHEEPRLSPANDGLLETGNVITVEPGVYYPAWGGIRLEDMVVVEKDACKCLNKFESFLEVE